MTAEEIRREGMLAVRERLGVVGTVRFLQQFNQPGRDYTADRAAWAESMTQEEIVSQLGRLREETAADQDR
jgi:hypothetical protein